VLPLRADAAPSGWPATRPIRQFLEALGNLLRSNAGHRSNVRSSYWRPVYIQIVRFPWKIRLDVRGPDVKAGSQERMKRELAAFLQEVSRFHPLVLFFDDLQWVDESTIDLLGLSGRNLCGPGQLILRASDIGINRARAKRRSPDIRESLAMLRAIGSDWHVHSSSQSCQGVDAKAGRTHRRTLRVERSDWKL